MRVPAALTAIALLLAGCAAKPKEVAVAPPAPLPMPLPPPVPPDGAAAGLSIPQRLPDGRFATPNTALSPQASVWHLRAALNVAVLGCADPDGALAAAYNRMLATQRTALSAAHRALAVEHGTTASFDAAMTRLYNYFAQPPAAAPFCEAARPLLSEAAALPAGAITAFAASALPTLDQPFIDFYARYDRYRIELAAWQSNQPVAAVRLAYQLDAITREDAVTSGPIVRTAAR